VCKASKVHDPVATRTKVIAFSLLMAEVLFGLLVFRTTRVSGEAEMGLFA
jgi:hypothetical protein